MPELSNAGSGSRTSRSGRSSSKIQTSAGATTKVQIQKHELPLQNSQAIMSGGMAQSNAIGNMGKAMSGFFNAVVEADSNLLEVERAENLRVASEAQRERRAFEADEKAEASYQKRLAEREAKSEAKALQSSINTGIVNTTFGALEQGFKENVLRVHDVMDGSSLATKADVYFTANFGEGTGDPLLDQQIKNMFEESVLPYLSAASEDRKDRVRSQATTAMSSEIGNRVTSLAVDSFADDFDRLKGLHPTMKDSMVSATLLGMYKEAAHAKGTFKQFARFISEAKVIKVGDQYKTFSEAYTVSATEMLSKGLEEHQARQTLESLEVSSDLIARIKDTGYSLTSDEDLAALVVESLQFSNRHGDSESTAKINKALDDKTKQLGILAAEDQRWFALSMGNLSSVKTTDYNQKQLPKMLSVPATNFLDISKTDEQFSQTSTAVAGILNNHKTQMGGLSPKLTSAINGMLTSKDPVMVGRGHKLINKIGETDSAMSAEILSDNKIAMSIFDAIDEGRIDINDLESQQDLTEALLDSQINADVAATTADYYAEQTGEPIKTDAGVFNAIMADGSMFFVTDDNDYRESIADYLNVEGLDEHNLHISSIGPVAKKFMNIHRSLSVSHELTGRGSADPDRIAADVWKKMMPTLGYERTGTGQYNLIMKAPQYIVPDSTEPLIAGSQMLDKNYQVSPFDPTKTVNPSNNMDTSVQQIGDMPFVSNSPGGVGFRPTGNKTGTFVVTKTDADTDQVEDIILGVGFAYDFGNIGGKTNDNKLSRGGLGKNLDATSVPITLTGDVVVDTAALKENQKNLPLSFHLISIFPNGTSPAEKKKGTVNAINYRIGVYPHLSKKEVPKETLTDEEIDEMSKGGHIDPRMPKPRVNQSESPYKNFQGGSINSQSDAKQTALLQEGAMNQLKVSGMISPLVGLTKPIQLGLLPSSIDTKKLGETAENVSWFMQDAYTAVKNHMGTTSDPEYASQRFEMIAEREAWRAGSYWDGVKNSPSGKGFRTVGYGYNMDSVGHKDLFMETLQVGSNYYDSVHAGDTDITEAQGRKLFDAAVDEAESIIDNRLKGVDLNHQQRLALVSMAYNSPKLIGNNLVGFLKSGDMEGAVNEILFKSNRTRMLGLYNRRYEEALTFVGANREHGMPSYLAYMADVLPEKFAAKYAASEEVTGKPKAKV